MMSGDVYNFSPDSARVSAGFLEGNTGDRRYVVSLSFRVNGDIHVYHLDSMLVHDLCSVMQTAAGTECPIAATRPSP
jgi:hypothetical protein